MHKHPDLTESRIKLAIDRRLKTRVHPAAVPVTIAKWDVGGEPEPFAHALAAAYTPFKVGDRWGASWDTTWFRITGKLPADWAGQTEAVLRVDLGPNPTWAEGFSCEGLVYKDGEPAGAVNLYRDDAMRFTDIQGGEAFEVYIEAAANVRPENVATGDWTVPTEFGGEPRFTLKRCELALFDRDAWKLQCAYELLAGTLEVLPKDAPRRGQVLAALNKSLNVLEDDDPATTADAMAVLQPALEKRNGDTAHHVSAIGHAHIDTAWLWPLRETIRKCARTFSTALNYMDEYPAYIFGCSQPIQYAWMKHHYPGIYERIKAAVKRGQWQVMGSMWVEPDCNLASGESLVRQLLHGKRFFMDEFGVETDDVWIPDVFGYSAAMPQLMKQAGVTSFLTQKISWNQFNRFPHHTFNWRGIDGTEIFTHFPPADTYNGCFSAQEVAKGQSRFLEHDRATRSLYPFGHGDGGGGPSRQMLENAKLLEDLEGMPRVTIEPTTAFFEKAKQDAADLPTWVGELYLEYHRGTYTTQGRTKRGNRKGEFALRDAEFFDAIDTAVNGPAQPLPPDAVADMALPDRAFYDVFDHPQGDQRGGKVGLLDRAWKLLLTNQFHDILPGSSIGWVYEDAARDYETIQLLAAQVRDDATSRIAASLGDAGALRESQSQQPTQTPAPRSGAAIADGADATQGQPFVFNTLSHTRREVIDHSAGPTLVVAPSCGYTSTDNTAPDVEPVCVEHADGGVTLDNGLLRVTIDTRTGHLTGVTDYRAAGRETLAPPTGSDAIAANVLQLHHDLPNQWDAWDVDAFYKEQCETIDQLDSIEVAEQHALRAKVHIRRAFRKSMIEQTIVLRAGSARIDFETRVDWQERHRFLKAAFPVNVRSEYATYDIQFGHVQRPTHDNTSWDLARFEVCAHKWADLSEGGPPEAGGYGVALLNDCKYGHDIRDNVMRLSLLRGPVEPDPEADLGEHTFTYSLFPHPGDFRAGRVIEEAYNLNVPLIPWGRQEGLPHNSKSWLGLDQPGIIIEAVKVAEDGEGIIVRLYEAYGARRDATLSVGFPVARVTETDLLERSGNSAVDVNDGTVALAFAPFEIKTLRFR
ncbi:alpha-mannosidase [Phycisphaeraceae bacterium D3-23]